MNIIKSLKSSDSRSILLISCFPALVILIMVPFTVYLNNQIDYSYNILIMLPFIILLFFTVSLCPIIFYFSNKWQKRISQLLFFFGIYLLLSDVITPINWGLMDGESKIIESSTQMWIQLVIIAILILLSIKLPNEKVRKFGSILVLILFIIQPFHIWFNLSEDTVWLNQKESKSFNKSENIAKRQLHKNINIYHIVFDGYGSLSFLESLKELRIHKDLNGFTFYKNNLSNYIVTDASVPSFTTGTFYKGGSFNEWQLQSKKSGIIKNLCNAGYKIWIYSPDRSRFWTHEMASHVKTSKELTKNFFYGTDTFNIAQISITRLAPSLLRDETFKLLDKVIIKLIRAITHMIGKTDVKFPGLKSIENYSYYKKLSVPLFKTMIDDEVNRDKRGNYIYGHFMIPHPPFVWDRSGNFTKESNYYEQSLCANNLMIELINELKKQKRYDDSLIIFQSDHGYHQTFDKKEVGFEFTKEIKKKINSRNVYFSSNGISQRIYSLLLIKPPLSESQPFEISEIPTQLIDIPDTIYDTIGNKNFKTEGKSVLNISKPNQREIHVYIGVYKRNQQKKVEVLGKHLFKTELMHLSFSKEAGWRLYPDLMAIF